LYEIDFIGTTIMQKGIYVYYCLVFII